MADPWDNFERADVPTLGSQWAVSEEAQIVSSLPWPAYDWGQPREGWYAYELLNGVCIAYYRASEDDPWVEIGREDTRPWWRRLLGRVGFDG